MKENNMTSIRKIFLIFFSVVFSTAISFAQEVSPAPSSSSDNIDSSRFSSVAVIQALNKTTAKTSILEIKVGDKIKFGSLKIIAHKCWQAPLDQKPDSKMLVEVFETQNEKSGEKESRIFYGWIFASSPSISGLEHPIYDLTAITCKNK